MRDKISRAKQFVNRHHDAYMWATGLITGVSVTYIAMQSPHGTTVLNLTREHAQSLIENAGDAVRYELPNDTLFLIISD